MDQQEQAKFSGYAKEAAEDEKWLPVPGFEGFYEVSNEGRVRRVAGGRGITVGRIRKPVSHNRYLVVQLWKNNKGYGRFVHCLVASAFLGQTPEGHEVNHKDGHKSNCALSNLEYVTRSENNKHAYATGLRRSGDAHPLATITSDRIAELRALHVPGVYGCRRLAKRFQMNVSTVKLILNRKNRKTYG